MAWKPKKYISRYKGKHGWEYQLLCPNCRKDNLWYNSTLGTGQCFTCPGNSRSGTLSFTSQQLRLKFDGLQSSILDEALLNIIKPRKAREVTQYSWQEHWEARWYLEKVRRCDPDVLLKSGVWYDKDTDRVCFPIQRIRPDRADVSTEAIAPYMSRVTDPEVSGWKVQPVQADKEQYWFNPVGITAPYIVLVEGIFDVLTPNLLGQAVATLGVKLYEDAQLWLMDRCMPTIVWFDPDSAGQKAVLDSLQILGGIVPILVLEYDKEPGDCTPVEAQALIQDAAKELLSRVS